MHHIDVAIGIVFGASLVLNLALTGWARIGMAKTLILVLIGWIVFLSLLALWDGNFTVELVTFEMIFVVAGFVPAMPAVLIGRWIGRRRQAATR
ncbi:hypothetical protein HJG53_09960 [Sphingomonas sp. ID1715]|uniref:hypothetical protein n=1 Tax=Sphingomonas sp. ID1715 TaxID=1656898 RepID=UPI0014888A6C|nr:hypothetical protein [Sphingomonas sp. ID1715]NNM77227.1 hypothetical protein [Sphingomonas sp. ID1715]